MTLAVFTDPVASRERVIGTSELAWVLDTDNDNIAELSIWAWNNGQTFRAALFDVSGCRESFASALTTVRERSVGIRGGGFGLPI